MEMPSDSNERETQCRGQGILGHRQSGTERTQLCPWVGPHRAHLDLLLQVFSPSHEILEPAKGRHVQGCGVRRGLQVKLLLTPNAPWDPLPHQNNLPESSAPSSRKLS